MGPAGTGCGQGSAEHFEGLAQGGECRSPVFQHKHLLRPGGGHFAPISSTGRVNSCSELSIPTKRCQTPWHHRRGATHPMAAATSSAQLPSRRHTQLSRNSLGIYIRISALHLTGPTQDCAWSLSPACPHHLFALHTNHTYIWSGFSPESPARHIRATVVP